MQRSSVYKYLACGESSERATVVRIEGYASVSSLPFRTEQTIGIVLQSRGQMHELLPPLSQPKVVESLTFAFDEATSAPPGGSPAST